MKKIIKILLKLVFGNAVIVATTIAIYYLFSGIINVDNLVVLKWFPLLSCALGFYFAGLINRKTKLIHTIFLYPSIFIFIVFKSFYFPLILSIVFFSVLSILTTRKELHVKYRIPAFLVLFGIFGIYLFSQPFIIEHNNFGIDIDQNLYNATELWNFSEKKPRRISNETFIDEKGNEIRLSQFKGRNIYITFWATWCSPCVREKPELEKLKKEFQEFDNLVFINISIDLYPAYWINYISEHNPTGIQLITKNGSKTRGNFQFDGIPFHIIVNKEGFYKPCHGPYEINKDILASSEKITEYIYTPRKIFKTTFINGKDTIIRVK